MTGIFCGKLFRCPEREATEVRNDRRYPHKYSRNSCFIMVNRRLRTLSCGVLICRRECPTQGTTRLSIGSRFRFAFSLAMDGSTTSAFTGKRSEIRRPPGHRPTSARARHSMSRWGKIGLKMKDPSGGTTGRVKAIWALGVDGRSRRI